MVRYLTPLPKMERVLSGAGGADQNRYVLLSFVSANFDRSVWPDPDRVDIHRERKPNLAFGFGRHSCMGMNITEHETGAFLRAILQNWPGWQLDGEPEIEWATEGEGADAIRVIDKFNQLRVVAPSPSTDR
jgi:cytochrome P450